MLYHLVLIICLQSACHEKRAPDWAYETSMSCMVDAQRQFSILLLDDPRLSLKSFACEPGERKQI